MATMVGTPYVVERSRLVNASPAVIYALVDDFREWTNWSPWEGLDPDLKRTYAGPAKGVGTSYSWTGNRKAGAGTMRITGAEPPSRIDVDLVFERPFANATRVVFLFRPEGAATRVTWQMHGENTGFAKVFSKVVSMDRLIGKDFEKGLDNLARVAES